MKTFNEYIFETFSIPHNKYKHTLCVEYDESFEKNSNYEPQLLAIAKLFNLNPDLFTKNKDSYYIEDDTIEQIKKYNNEFDEKANYEMYSLIYDDAMRMAYERFCDIINMNGVFDLFNVNTVKFCLTNESYEWFKEWFEEDCNAYATDIANESDNKNEFENRLVSEMFEKNFLDKNDFEKDPNGNPDFMRCKYSNDELIDMYVEKYIATDFKSNSDYVDEYISICGEDDFEKVVDSQKYDVNVDLDALWADFCSTAAYNEIFDYVADYVGSVHIQNDEYIIFYC